MNLTSLPKANHPGILSLFLDDEWWKDIYEGLFSNITFPCRTTRQEYEEWFRDLEYTKAKAYAIRRLALKSQPSHELRKALEGRLVSNQTIDRLLSEFQKSGYLNDAEWIEAFVQRQFAKGYGPRLVEDKLLQKGFPKSFVKEYLYEKTQALPNSAKLDRYFKRYTAADLADFKVRQKILGALCRKGYDINEAKDLIDAFVNKK